MAWQVDSCLNLSLINNNENKAKHSVKIRYDYKSLKFEGAYILNIYKYIYLVDNLYMGYKFPIVLQRNVHYNKSWCNIHSKRAFVQDLFLLKHDINAQLYYIVLYIFCIYSVTLIIRTNHKNSSSPQHHDF